MVNRRELFLSKTLAALFILSVLAMMVAIGQAKAWHITASSLGKDSQTHAVNPSTAVSASTTDLSPNIKALTNEISMPTHAVDDIKSKINNGTMSLQVDSHTSDTGSQSSHTETHVTSNGGDNTTTKVTTNGNAKVTHPSSSETLIQGDNYSVHVDSNSSNHSVQQKSSVNVHINSNSSSSFHSSTSIHQQSTSR